MPEHEFEIYLSVLSRLLKLTPEQTASIEDELRDHLEERFEELVRSGVERDEAIKQALDEFGDASGLAVNLTRVSQKPIRRWVIGSSIVSAAALLISATAFLMFEPDAASLPGATPAVAQTQPESPQPIASQSLLLDPQPDDLELAQLSEPSVLSFRPDIPLEEAMSHLADQHKVPIVLDPLMLLEGIVTPDQPLNVPLLGRSEKTAEAEPSPGWPHELTLSQVLNVMLVELDLTWYVQDGIIIVTTVDIANDPSKFLTTSYDIEPLIRTGISSESIIETIKENTNAMWQEIDGTGGEILVVGDILTVRQTYHAQQEIRRLLFKLAQPGDSPWIEYSEERESLEVALRRPCSVEFPPDTPLSGFLGTLSGELDVPFVIDPLMPLDGIVTEDQPVNAPAIANVPLEALLRLSLEELDLALVLQDGLPTVTTVDIANDPSRLAIGVYDVGPFVDAGVDTSDLTIAVKRMAGGMWEWIDGTGGALTLTENGLMVLRQTDEVHRSLQKLLATWRKGLKERKPLVPIEAGTPVTKFYHMPIETAESLKTVIPEMVAFESWKSDANPHGGTIHAVALAQKPPQISSPEKKDDDPSDAEKKKRAEGSTAASIGRQPPVVFAQFGGGGFGGGGLGGGPSRVDDNVLEFYSQSTGVLIITQSSAVHREIDRFLASLRVSTRGRNEASDSDVGKSQFGGMGGGGGFF